MKTLVYCDDEETLDGFKFGLDFRHPGATYRQSVNKRGYWLLIEDDTPGDNQTYTLTALNGLEHTDTGVEV